MENTSLPAPVGKIANAVTHGLRATDELLVRTLRSSEKDAFNDLRNLIFDHYKPRGPIETLLTEKIAIHHFRLFRLYKLESAASVESLRAPISIVHHLDKISRYDSRISAQLLQTQEALKRLHLNQA